jgi:hypothetical protein
LERTEVESGIRMKSDPEAERYVESLRNSFRFELAVSFVLIESVQNFIVDQAWSV